jgi:hypothetical protein
MHIVTVLIYRYDIENLVSWDEESKNYLESKQFIRDVHKQVVM